LDSLIARDDSAMLRTLVDSLPGICYVLDRNVKIVLWNVNLERVTGYGPDEIGRMSPLEFFPQNEQMYVAQRIGAVFSAKPPPT